MVESGKEVTGFTEDFESKIDSTIDKFFSSKGVVKDTLEIEEKKIIVKELALANKKSEIVPKLNNRRKELGLPELGSGIDIFYYAREYATLIEDISLFYASNLAKKFRFANRITRIGKLNDVAESVLDRIAERQSRALNIKEEILHNDNIKLFSTLLNAVDEQMGKLKITKLDVNVRSSDKPVVANHEEVGSIIRDALKKYSTQLPASVDANFSQITDYEKCSFGEEWTNNTFCQYYTEKCKVRTGEITNCPKFCNKILLTNKDYMARRYVADNMSVRQIAEISGCKETDDRVIDHVRGKLRALGIYRDTPRDTQPVVPPLPT